MNLLPVPIIAYIIDFLDLNSAIKFSYTNKLFNRCVKYIQKIITEIPTTENVLNNKIITINSDLSSLYIYTNNVSAVSIIGNIKRSHILYFINKCLSVSNIKVSGNIKLKGVGGSIDLNITCDGFTINDSKFSVYNLICRSINTTKQSFLRLTYLKLIYDEKKKYDNIHHLNIGKKAKFIGFPANIKIKLCYYKKIEFINCAQEFEENIKIINKCNCYDRAYNTNGYDNDYIEDDCDLADEYYDNNYV